MLVLAIDTCLEACSVGVGGDGTRPVTVSEAIGRGHAERLLPMIDEVLANAGAKIDDVRRIGVTNGPGSFTGVRIGIAAARALSLVTGAETVSLGTFAALAARANQFGSPHRLLVALDARRGEVYGQFFAENGAPEGPPEVGSSASFAARLDHGTVLAGAGADLVAAAAPSPLRIVHRDAYPDIAILVAMTESATPDGAAPRPLYLRPPDAKPQAGAGVPRR